MTRYLTDQDNDNLAITKGFEKKLTLILNGLPSADISLDVINFDIGVEGEEALISGLAVILEPLTPQKITVTIPAGTFQKPHKRLVFQLRWTPQGSAERILAKRFLDVRNPVTPKP